MTKGTYFSIKTTTESDNNIHAVNSLPVLAEVLKAEYVEHADRLAIVARSLALLVDGLVDLLHEPDEHASIHALHERVPHVHRRIGAHRRGNALASREDRPRRKRIGKAIHLHLYGEI